MNNENGFTLLECLFSMAIFAVTMLGVISLQLNAIQANAETRRKDMANQLLTAGAEMVACADYDAESNSSDLFHDDRKLGDAGFGQFLDDVKSGDAGVAWMSSGNEKAMLFLRHQTPSGTDNFRNVYLVAAWNSVKPGQTETLHRMMVKPENIHQ